MTQFKLLSRPRCYVVHEDIGLIHTVIQHTHTIEVHTDMVGGDDMRVRQDGVEYEKYRHFANWSRFEDAMPGTARCVSDANPLRTTFPFRNGGDLL